MQTERLTAAASDDCWTSTTILRGSADVLAAMRGLSAFFLDLRDEPEVLSKTAARISALHACLLDMHFGIVQQKHGGWGAPAMYRDLFMPHDAALVRHLGDFVLFHLHSTGLRHCGDVLEIPGIAGLEITVEANGPKPAVLAPIFSEILERSRLILMVDGHFEQMADVLRKLPKRGLYILVTDRFVPDESAFQAFLGRI